MSQKAHHVGETAPMIEMTIGDKLEEIAAANPYHPAFIMPHQDIRWSY